jgi:hypothetical protein
MIDPAHPGDEALARALRRLASMLDEPDAPTVGAGFEREIALIDLELQYRGGEGQSVAARPDDGAPREGWLDWLARFGPAVQDEWRRISGVKAPGDAGVLAPTGDGPLSGVSVFVVRQA